MKKEIFIFAAIFLVGCSVGREKIETYLREPKYLIQDPHFANYQSKRDELESRYLQKEVTYAEYIEEREKLDQKYAKEVYERDQKIHAQY